MDRYTAMQTFVRVVEAGSFAAVAEQMNVARSVVTRQVAALEAHLQVKLLTRTTRSLALTAAGEAWLAASREILGLLDNAESSLREGDALSGRIRVGLPLVFGLTHLGPAMVAFAQQHPQVALELQFTDERANLVEEGLDLSIRITAQLQPSDIVRRLGQVRMHTLASPAYLATHGTPKRPEDLAGADGLLYERAPTPDLWAYQRDGETVAVRLHRRLLADNGVALAQAAAAGMGYTRAPDFIAQPFLERGEVVAVLAEFEPGPLPVFAVLPSNRWIPRRVDALITHVERELQRLGLRD